MNRRRARRAAPRTVPAPRAGTPGAAGPRLLLVRALVAVLLLAGVLLLARHPWGPHATPDPLDGLDRLTLGLTADALEARGEYARAVPYVLHLLRTAPPTYDYASRASTTLNNASIEVRVKDGHVIPATRSSVERVELFRESLAWSKRAEELAPGPEYRAVEIASRAEQLSSWGFHREAFAEFARASETSPLDADFLAKAHWEQVMLAAPTTVVPRASAPGPAMAAPDSSGRPGAPVLHER